MQGFEFPAVLDLQDQPGLRRAFGGRHGPGHVGLLRKIDDEGLAAVSPEDQVEASPFDVYQPGSGQLVPDLLGAGAPEHVPVEDLGTLDPLAAEVPDSPVLPGFDL